MFVYYVKIEQWEHLFEDRYNTCESFNRLSTKTWNCNESLWMIPGTYHLLED